MAGYKSPHLRLHGNPAAQPVKKSEGTPAKPSQKGAMHEEGEMHRAAGADVEHVSKSHPGETTPHPTTGIHAVHVHHIGGKHEMSGHGSESHGHKFMTHTHHADGSVRSDHHADDNALADHMQQSFPTSEGDDMQHDQNADNDSFGGGGSLANMSSLGGE